jgi:hypothetical protein
MARSGTVLVPWSACDFDPKRAWGARKFADPRLVAAVIGMLWTSCSVPFTSTVLPWNRNSCTCV